MTLSEFLIRVSYALRGTDDDAPTIGDGGEGDYWVSLLNQKKDELYEDVTKNWTFSYGVESIGVVSASVTPSYDLPTSFIALSGDGGAKNGGVYVITTDGNRLDIPVIQPERRNPDYREAFIAGFNPQKLYITNEIVAGEQIVGGTVYVPGYYMPEDIGSDADVIPFPDPQYAVYAVASEIAFNDITYEDKTADLSAKAGDRYEKMVNKNRMQISNGTRGLKTNVRRISGVRR